jgi:pilus assembly protein CpaF
VIDRLDTGGIKQLDPEELGQRVAELVNEALHQREIRVTSRQREQLVVAISDEILGLGPLEPLLADPTVSDILVNTADLVYVERDGVLVETGVCFRDNDHLLNTINRIVSQIGRRIDESSPMVDARMPDGSRINAVIPPLAIDGPILSIRRFGSSVTSPRQLVEKGSFTPSMAHYFNSAVRSKCNILVCGGTGAGKTTLLNALSHYISSRERIVTIEDSAELRLQQKHVVRMETRPPNIEGRGEVTIRDLVRNALRMRPDRIIVGEVRASEVLDMIQAMNTGHEGSMTTIHANGVPDAFTRLMSMMSMAGTKLSESMMMQMVARAIDIVIHLTRDMEGQRRVSEVAEIEGIVEGEIRSHTVFAFERRTDDPGHPTGAWTCAGWSRLLDRFAAARVPLEQRWLEGKP